MLFGNNSDNLLIESSRTVGNEATGTLQKMIVADGDVAIDLNLNKLRGNGRASKNAKPNRSSFAVERDSFFTILVFNDELRGPLPSAMPLVPLDMTQMPGKLNESYRQLVLENMEWGGSYDLAVRDSKSGFIFFNIEGYVYDYDPTTRNFRINDGRLVLSKEFAQDLGRPNDAGTIVGNISVSATMRPTEVSEVVNGEVRSDSMPAAAPEAGTTPGPDVVVGDVSGLAQFGSATGTQVGLALATDSCNFGTVNLNWFQMPNNDHPVIPQNLYRMSGGATNDERFEQVGQSSVKHAFTALTNNICSLGCNGVGGSQLGSGCSDPYSASLNAGPSLGSRAWINPFTGAYPRGDSATNPNDHTGHTGDSNAGHRIRVEIADLNTSLNAGATYYAEGQYITPHEYTWCQTNPTQCNMYNNVSYRRYSVTGTASPFSFTAVGTTQRTKPAISAWTGATLVEIKPAAGTDGIGTVGYKVTNPSPGVWHYEYAIYNQNLDRAIQSFSVPIGSGVTVSNVGFHAPPQQPGTLNDGTVGSAGFSSAAWSPVQSAGSLTWGSESFAANPNANAIRWGTLYNFRFDSNRPPVVMDATVGFYKTGAPIVVSVQVPQPVVASNVSVGGRVTNSSGFGVGGVMIVMSDSNNNLRTAITSSFGYYTFDNVLTGATYSFTPSTKRYNFTPQTIAVNGALTNVDFVGQ